MFKRSFTLTTLFALLIASTSVPLNVAASPLNEPQSTQEQAKVEMKRAIEEARQTATYDQSGRVTGVKVAALSSKKVGYGFKYDEQNRLRYLIREDGTQFRLEYDQLGQWQGLLFPDGGRMVFVRNEAGKVIDIKREAKSLSYRDGRGVSFVKASVVQGSDCQAAVRLAVLALVEAAIECAEGSPTCPVLVVIAAEAARQAYVICNPPS